MRSSTGRWVTGDNFFNREDELASLECLVKDGNHVLVTGQRRMGKTSVIRELGRQLQAQGWTFFFTDVEGAPEEEEVIAEIAQTVHQNSFFKPSLLHRLGKLFRTVDEFSASKFRVKFRADTTAGNWRRRGAQLIRSCADHDKPVLLVLDELPIFLKRLLRRQDGEQRVEMFLSWLRKVAQENDRRSLVIIVSGSIGLQPLTRRLGITDRINYLHPFRLGPWDRETTARCFHRLAEAYELKVDDGVAEAIYSKLGIGIPQHVQCFFTQLREHITRKGNKNPVTVADVDFVYEHGLLGPQGQIDLEHYASRLKDALGSDYTMAMEILATAAVQGEFTDSLRQPLERRVGTAPERITEVIGILVHDGYLERNGGSYRFSSHLLKDWWAARFRGHFVPLESRSPNSRSFPAAMGLDA